MMEAEKVKKRDFLVEFCTHEENLSGLRCGKSKGLGIYAMVPTVENVRKAVKDFLPEREIDESEMILTEQIHDSLEYGFFSVDLKVPDNPDFYC